MEQKQLSINDVFLQIQDGANMLRSQLILAQNEIAMLKKQLEAKEPVKQAQTAIPAS
jgi:hypothetical protein